MNNDLRKKKASEKYIEGSITLSEASRQAGLTLWEIEKSLVDKGYKSDYSVDDLEKELDFLNRPETRRKNQH